MLGFKFRIILFLAHRVRISAVLPWDRKFYLTHVMVPRLSCEGCTLVVFEITHKASSDVIVMLK